MPSDDLHSSSSIDDGQSEQTPSKATGMAESTTTESPSSPPNPSAMYRTMAALVNISMGPTAAAADMSNRSTSSSSSYATNTKTRAASREEYDNYNNYFKTVGIHFQRTPNLLWQQATRVDHQRNEYNFIDDIVDINEFVDSDVAASYRDNQLCSDTNPDEVAIVEGDDSNGDHDNHQYVKRGGSNDYDICHYNNNNGNQNDNKLSGSDNNGFNDNHNYNRNNNCSANGIHDNNVNNEWPEPHRKNRKTPNTLDLNLSNTMNSHTNTLTLKKRKLSNSNKIVSGKYTEQIQLNGIVEECEYDSDIGKFNCKTNGEPLASDNSSGSIEFTLDNSSGTSSFDERNINDLNNSPKQKYLQSFERNAEHFNIDGGDMDCAKKMVLKRIEFFENVGEDKRTNVTIDGRDECDSPRRVIGGEFLEIEKIEKNKQFSSALCLTTFIMTVCVLYCFPLPN